ncbi:diaminopimelate epimerase [Caloramator quimbayensis]|uniref:Diaminopimelate epimerase n=1 Tax=Caloramator quimbayensis TaxID=1147123 RepID=A0A1T4XSD8_9CLOT|nr:diaminopimelate epimerase [Caloramator quimbayensis]SKA92482.1 diaminopimelate epimerase [Caloramator quimbayensis]
MFFTKMHGLGNDFIVFDNLLEYSVDWSIVAKKSCDRHLGIGADGILIVEKSDISDIKMTIINSDGSLAEMCGNGIRCFAKYVYEKGIINKQSFNVETLSGIKNVKLKVINEIVCSVEVDMGRPSFVKNEIPFLSDLDNKNYTLSICGKEYNLSTILLGVPHTIVYVNEIDEKEVIEIGKIIENNSIFPKKTNVNFVEVLDRKTIKVRTWERGAGLTLACGTGTCASVVACYINGKTDRTVTAKLAAGDLNVLYYEENVVMEGPAEFICEGIYSL